MHALYVLRFDDGARYIGASSDIEFRIERHRKLARMYAGRVNFSVESIVPCASRKAALASERAAIAAAKVAGTELRNGDSAAHFRGVPKSTKTRRKIGAANRRAMLGRRKITPVEGCQMFVMQATAGWTQEELAQSFSVSRATVRRALQESRAS